MGEEDKYVHPMEVAPFSWLVRPCLNYWEEHTHCRSFRNRFYQYYIDGELADCTQWKEQARLCDRWERKGDQDALVGACQMHSLIEIEKQKYADRIGPHLANDVWEKRTGPPKNWARPLPETHQKRIEESYLKKIVDSGITPSPFSCVIL